MPASTLPAAAALEPVLTAPPAERLNVRQFRSYRLRLPATAVCLLTGLGLTLLHPITIPAAHPLHLILLGLAASLLALGIAIRLWSIACINARKTVGLVMTGPYSLCRNPLYVGTLCIVLAYLCIWQDLSLALLTLPIIGLYLYGVVPAEEAVMHSYHGGAFEDYCRRVPRWLPRWSGYVREPQPAVRTIAFRREFECGLWWIGIALACYAGAMLR